MVHSLGSAAGAWRIRAGGILSASAGPAAAIAVARRALWLRLTALSLATLTALATLTLALTRLLLLHLSALIITIPAACGYAAHKSKCQHDCHPTFHVWSLFI
jgi:hypothetical protein